MLERARERGRVLISADTDFGRILARERQAPPCCFCSGNGGDRAQAQASLG
ncbi:MAG: hypothetical protein H0W21_02390 [Actinobacteria bacterium]|nr:hypothetical protein [Actinomycetota bacterium]